MKTKAQSENARNFFLTINKAVIPHYEDIKYYLIEERKCNYLFSCIEKNSSEQDHIHIYVQFPRQVRLAYKKTCGANVQVCHGNEQENIAYLSKDGENSKLDEYGTLRLGCGKNQHTLMALELKDRPITEVAAQEYKTWQALQGFDSLRKRDCYKPDIEVYFIYGPSGSGKSKFVFDHIGDDEQFDRVKYCNGFWQGVNVFNQPEVAWYDEFRSSDMPAKEFINFVDYYVNIMNVKYQTGVKNKYKKIFITSIEDPTEIYRNLTEESRQQWLRRMKILNMEEVNSLQNN